MNKFPYVKVCFVIEGKKLDLKKLTEELGILPTETREINDWPKVIKSNLNLPEELQPRYVWCIYKEMDICKQMKIPIYEIIAQIKGKEQKLLEFCKSGNFKKSLCITIQAETMNFPEIILPSDIIIYFGKLEIEISFDIYAY